MIIGWVAIAVCVFAAVVMVALFIKLLTKPEKVWGDTVRFVDRITETLIPGPLTREKAQRYTEQEARHLFGDAEVDSYLAQCDREDERERQNASMQ